MSSGDAFDVSAKISHVRSPADPLVSRYRLDSYLAILLRAADLAGARLGRRGLRGEARQQGKEGK